MLLINKSWSSFCEYFSAYLHHPQNIIYSMMITKNINKINPNTCLLIKYWLLYKHVSPER